MLTIFVNILQSSSSKYIPRLIDSSLPIHAENGVLNPSEWTSQDVVQFLEVNDCSAYSDNFIKQVRTLHRGENTVKFFNTKKQLNFFFLYFFRKRMGKLFCH